MKANHKFIFAGLLLIVFAFIAQQYFLDRRYSAQLTNGWRHFIEISLIVIIGFTGYIGLKAKYHDWQPKLWAILYGSAIALLTLLALIDVFVYTITYHNQYRFTSIKSFLSSPLPYWGIWLLSSIKLPAVK